MQENNNLPETITQSTEPAVQCETWIRARLLDMMLSDPASYIPDLNKELDDQLAMVFDIAVERDEPLADALYACVWAIGLARKEGIRLANVFEIRVRDLVNIILADTPTAELAGAEVSASKAKEQK